MNIMPSAVHSHKEKKKFVRNRTGVYEEATTVAKTLLHRHNMLTLLALNWGFYSACFYQDWADPGTEWERRDVLWTLHMTLLADAPSVRLNPREHEPFYDES